MPIVGVHHIACSCKKIAAQKFGSQIMALPVVAYSRGAPLCRLEEVVEVVLENSLVISPLSCCVKKIHAASLGGYRGVGQMAAAAAAGKIIHSSCFLLHHSSWRVASESHFSARRTRRKTSRCFSTYEFVEGDDKSCVEAVALVGSGSSTVSTVGDQLGVGVVPTYLMVQIGEHCEAWNASNKLQDWVADFRNQRRWALTRRLFLTLPMMTAFILPAEMSLAAAPPAQTPSLGNSFLRTLGIGDSDIYYPREFEGIWNCYSTLTAVDTPQGEDRADRKSLEFSRKQLGYTVEYKARFFPFQSKIIGDRLFTTLSLVESTIGKDVLRRGVWTPDKPNQITLELRNGLKVTNLVTKRSSEVTGPGQFDTSEFSRQVFDNGTIKDGPPTVKASQNFTRYRWDATKNPVSKIEAFQTVAMFPLPGEGMDVMDAMGMDKPITVYKYRVYFTRQSGS
ncbi:unnamed protein product [Sphagnum balticum]